MHVQTMGPTRMLVSHEELYDVYRLLLPQWDKLRCALAQLLAERGETCMVQSVQNAGPGLAQCDAAQRAMRQAVFAGCRRAQPTGSSPLVQQRSGLDAWVPLLCLRQPALHPGSGSDSREHPGRALCWLPERAEPAAHAGAAST